MTATPTPEHYDGTCANAPCPLPVTEPHVLCPRHRRLATISETWADRVNPDEVQA